MTLLRIKLSSIRLWVWPDGDKTKKPIRAFADAEGFVFTGLTQVDGGENFNAKRDYLNHNNNAIIELRKDWDGFYDNPEEYYGKLTPQI